MFGLTLLKKTYILRRREELLTFAYYTPEIRLRLPNYPIHEKEKDS